MPTENRTSNNEQMVSVPRELLERCDFGKNTAVAMAALPELRALLAQPAAQHQSEPVFMVRSHGSCSWEESNGEGLDIALSMPDEYEVRKFYLHPPTSDGFSAGDMADQGAKAFAARDGEVQELRELEETLRTSIFNKSAENQKLKVDCRRLLDKMTERDALLNCWMNLPRAASSPELNEVRRKTDHLLSASAEPSAVGDGVRDARDYAIEHAGYLADAADQVLADYQAYSLAQMLENEAGDDGDDEHEEAVDSARNELHEGLANLRSMAYEFRKRRSQAGNVASAESIAPVEPYQGIPGTSFQRINALANQGE